jgi:hypothetical protein
MTKYYPAMHNESKKALVLTVEVSFYFYSVLSALFFHSTVL